VRFRLNHIGLVSPNIEELSRVFRVLEMDAATEPVPDPLQKVSASFVEVGHGRDLHIEILEPTEKDSPITGFLEKRGGGLHHLCFEVDDIGKASSHLVQHGFKLVCAPVECAAYDVSMKRHCSNPSRIAFFLVNDSLLLEIIEVGQ
jgi:methylmalonyl-CoA/ethylmalonyl-CoA epimerase